MLFSEALRIVDAMIDEAVRRQTALDKLRKKHPESKSRSRAQKLAHKRNHLSADKSARTRMRSASGKSQMRALSRLNSR